MLEYLFVVIVQYRNFSNDLCMEIISNGKREWSFEEGGLLQKGIVFRMIRKREGEHIKEEGIFREIMVIEENACFAGRSASMLEE